MNFKNLSIKAKKLRSDTFVAFIKKGEAHLGGSFSMIELLLSLYEVIMKRNDKFILSKAHASFPLCILLREKGLYPEIKTHLEIDIKNGINCTAGSLGHGLPIATGMAFANRSKDFHCIISDGVHVAPGAVLCGGVKVSNNTFIGANSVINQNITIGENVIIGSGSVVINDIPNGRKVYGNPAK